MSIKKKLYRSEKNKIVAGVCGGLAEYFNIDPVLVRIAFVIVSFFDGVGILAYIILWAFVSKKSDLKNVNSEENLKEFSKEVKENLDVAALNIKKCTSSDKTKNIIAILIIVVGVVILLNQFNYIWFLSPYFVFPVLLIIFGIYLLLKDSKIKNSKK